MNEALRPAPLDSTQAAAARQLSIVVPTFNERENVVTLYERLKATLGETPWEVVFVDDNSPDETWQVVRELSQRDPRVRCLRFC